ncbi:hypothetical protein HaLaN_32813, partial [Haematococcus lacustris]
ERWEQCDRLHQALAPFLACPTICIVNGLHQQLDGSQGVELLLLAAARGGTSDPAQMEALVRDKRAVQALTGEAGRHCRRVWSAEARRGGHLEQLRLTRLVRHQVHQLRTQAGRCRREALREEPPPGARPAPPTPDQDMPGRLQGSCPSPL